jgi:predicted enzyme related to lactoylglutathione lyase
MADLRWSPGTFVWRELMTDDVDAARRFYADLFAWSWKGEPMGPAGTYWLASRGERQVAGVTGKPPGVAMPSSWSSYVLVDDVDGCAARCRAEGGRVLKEPMDIPGVGRFAVLADRWGAAFLPFRSSVDEPPPPRGMPPPGTFCWETLVTPDVEGAIAFYGRVVGFGTGATPNGAGKVFTAGGFPVADLQPSRGGAPSSWSTYVAVEGAEATRDRAARLGARVLLPRLDIEKVGVISFIADPGGAALGLFQPGA